jgi:formate C-acetyltransferase
MSNITSKTQKLKDSLFQNKRHISLERAKLYTESYMETEREPSIIRPPRNRSRYFPVATQL